jgi:hypothetical protein
MAPSALDKLLLYISKQYATLDLHPHIPQPSYRIVLIIFLYMLIRPYFMIPETRRDRFAWIKRSWARITQDVKKRLEERKTLAETKKEREVDKGEGSMEKLLEKAVEKLAMERKKKSHSTLQEEIVRLQTKDRRCEASERVSRERVSE